MNDDRSSHWNVGRSRRDFLRFGTTGIMGLSLCDVLQRRAIASPQTIKSPARNVIMIFLTGGPATIDMWDMKPDAREAIRGEFQPRDTCVPGIQICEHLPKLASQMHRTTLVRSVRHSIPEHTQGAAYVMTGNRPVSAFEYPSLGSLSASLLKSNKGVPTYMAVGSPPSAGAGELGSSLNPFEFSISDQRSGTIATSGIGLPSDFTVTDLERRQKILERIERRMRFYDSSPLPRQLDVYQHEALDILRSDKINQALNVDSETEQRRGKYGPGFLGRSTLTASRLVEAGARFVTIGFGDWDTHANNFTRLRTSLLPQLDQALASLLEDLHDRGLLDETIVYCTGEFGRTPYVNSSAGRDHWSKTMTALIAGGGFQQGFVYGATENDGSDPVENPCSPDDLSATIFHRLGFEPEQTVPTQSGRPVPLFRHGHVISKLLS